MELLTSEIHRFRRLYIRFINVGRNRHNCEDFCEKFTYPMHINEEKITTTQSTRAILSNLFSLLDILSSNEYMVRRPEHTMVEAKTLAQ